VRREQLPLDGQAYLAAVRELERLIRQTPDLSNLGTIREFLAGAPLGLLGVRTAEDFATADAEKLRVLTRYMILAATAMEDLHESARRWLTEHDYALPPWDVGPGQPPQPRSLSYEGRVAATVSWTPQPSVSLAPDLTERERRWVLAMAIATGERPDWTEPEVQRFAAYLTMGGASFGADRELSDAQIAQKYDVPESAVMVRRALDDREV
jgi:hypothetical protein